MYILLQMVLFSTMGVLLKTNNMVITELINILQEIQKEKGDLPVLVNHWYIKRIDYDDEILNIDNVLE